MTENAVKLVAEAIAKNMGSSEIAARAAIAAVLRLLEEPTEKMILAAPLEYNLVAGWRAMLAAWRKEIGI